MASRTFTINQDGSSRTFTVNTGVGPQGPAGPAGTTSWSGLTGEANHIPFDTTPTSVPTTLGTLSWNAGDACLEYAVDGGTISIGKETFDYYTNLSGVAMVDGDIVSIVGATGNRTAVDLTDATDATSAANVIGMVTQGAANNGTVRVTKTGSVHSLNTNGLTEGGTIYVDPSNPGKWTMIRPTSPNHVVSIGFVQVAHSTNGVVDVAPNHQCITAADIIDPQNVVTAERVASTIISATEKTTPVDADQLGITDSAAAGVLKRLTFENLWTWVKSKLDGNLTIAGTKTWSGQQEATGQAANNATSLLTRALGDSRYFRRIVAYKTANTARQSTTTNTDDPDLQIYLEPGTYILHGFVAWFTVTGQTHGFQGATVFTGTNTFWEGWYAKGNGGQNQAIFNCPDNYTTTYPFLVNSGSTGATGSVRAEGMIVVTVAGYLKFQWAQNTSAAANTSVGRGSYIIAEKIA